MSALKRSKDRKVTNLSSPNGKTPKIANTFGLPSGAAFSCPGQTSVCGSVCYAGKLERVYKGVSDVLMHNYTLLKDADYDDMVVMLSAMMIDFVKECDKWGAPKAFRIHWDGDFFSLTYVRAWITVIAAFPDVQFWAYTRWVPAGASLAQANLPNLALYFSADAENMKQAEALRDYCGIRLAVLGETFDQARELMGKPAARCPEQTGQIPLISDEGGACIKCGLCPMGKADILFSITKR